MNTKKFIGYYASFRGDRAIVNEEHSVIIFGKKRDFINYHENHPEKVKQNPIYEKIHYDEIMEDINKGDAFAFDEIAYNRFYPVAPSEGHNFGPEDFSITYKGNSSCKSLGYTYECKYYFGKDSSDCYNWGLIIINKKRC